MPFFSRFKNKGAQPASKTANNETTNGNSTLRKPRWQSTWSSATVVPEEVEELIHACTLEMKSRAEALDAPFLLLPFRPNADTSSARMFIRNYFKYNAEGSSQYRGAKLQQELRLTEPLVLCSVIKWCWSRMPGGVVTWPVYEGFQVGEREAKMAPHAFDTFIPIGATSQTHKNIIFDFFDLLAAVAAHGKMNGLGGRKLSRMAGWWAFELSDDGKGFEGGYRSWTAAADATSHLFFAYLRSLSPEADPTMSVIDRIPRSLQALLATTEYPPEQPTLLYSSTPRVVMLVDTVSPTPFALIRRAKHFDYRDNDRVLREYAEYEDPMDALTEESKRVLYAVSSTNSATARLEQPTLAKDESWSNFQNMGFADMDEKEMPDAPRVPTDTTSQSLRSEPRSRAADLARPTTPSWAEFMSSGFEESDINNAPSQLHLPPDKQLPPLVRAHTSHNTNSEPLAPGELAAITNVELDDAFWWVWMTSLSSEEPASRKAVFGRCALIEVNIFRGNWLIMEEQVKGASADMTPGVLIAPKRSFFGTLKRGKLSRKRSTYTQPPSSPPSRMDRAVSATPSKNSLAPDQHSKIKQAAAALAMQKEIPDAEAVTRRGRTDDAYSTKTNSMLTIGLQSEAGPAMKWTSAYDKNTIRAQYLGDMYAGRGVSREDILARTPSATNINEEANKENSKPSETVAASTLAPEPAPQALSSTPSMTALPQAESMPPPPLPDKTLPEGPSALDKELGVSDASVARKPLPASDNHPALRQKSVEDTNGAVAQSPTTAKPNPAAVAASRAMYTVNQTSPTATRQNAPGLKKQESNAGIKKLFGRKPKDSRQGLDQQNSGLAVPNNESTTRRLSIRRKKAGQFVAVDKSQAISPPQTADSTAAPVKTAEPVMQSSQFEPSAIQASRSEMHEQNEAEREFSRFDQGPMVDMPSATPQDSSEHLPAPQAKRHFVPPPAEPEMPAELDTLSEPAESQTLSEEPAETHEPAVVSHDIDDDAQSEATIDKPAQYNGENDRWAAIRENAARRAARSSEDHQSVQSRPSQSARTDDGETSGEETIESRVARIKARVAELTGGMDSSSARR